MPKTKQPSTKRVQQHRKRKRIAEIKKKSRWLVWALQTFYREHDIPLSTWIPALDLHTSPVTVHDIQVSVFLPNEDDFIRHLDDAGIEKAIVRIDQKDAVIVRPKFLGDEIL